jgi:hypothetical protein
LNLSTETTTAGSVSPAAAPSLNAGEKLASLEEEDGKKKNRVNQCHLRTRYLTLRIKFILILLMNKLPAAIQIVSLFCEGNSMRAVSRLADVSINTVAKLLADAGRACATFHDEPAERASQAGAVR